MKFSDQSSVHLTYCLNVHPGEAWADNLAAIRTHALAVRNRVASDRPFGLGLRLSSRAALELTEEDQLGSFESFLRANSLYAFTVNGFPYGAFHRVAVKEQVYQPDWRTPERLAYTNRLVDIMARLAPDGISPSISTLPGSYKAWVRSKSDVNGMVLNLAGCVAHMAEVEAATGRRVILGLEPEPDCYIETTTETIRFFESELFREGARHVARLCKCPADRAEALIRRHLGICVDTCHLALQFEELPQSLAELKQHGITIAKVQLSAALRCRVGDASVRELGAFEDKVYLHQTRIRRTDGQMKTYPDLTPTVLAGLVAADDGSELRSHFHVPLYWQGSGPLQSTTDQLTPGFLQASASVCDHLEIETYTFHVLPESLRSIGVDASVAREFETVTGNLQAGKSA